MTFSPYSALKPLNNKTFKTGKDLRAALRKIIWTHHQQLTVDFTPSDFQMLLHKLNYLTLVNDQILVKLPPSPYHNIYKNQ